MKIVRLLSVVVFTINVTVLTHAQQAYVPPTIEFAGLELELTKKARAIIEEDMNKLMKSPTYLNKLVRLADMYFPLIERTLDEQKLPEDFKYLAIQESHLTSDIVSSSNAVGYWQFKKETAVEQGLRVDHLVDERMHIIASTKGAAKYLKKNHFFLKNWVYALLSYNMGLGGVKSQVDDKYFNARKMTIDHKMHWYVLRFLAHKLVFEDIVGKGQPTEYVLFEYGDTKGKSLKKIAKETGEDQELIEAYNKWLRRGSVPDDKDYVVIIPVDFDRRNAIAFSTYTPSSVGEENEHTPPAQNNNAPIKVNTNVLTPLTNYHENDLPIIFEWYDLQVIQSGKKDSKVTLAHKGDISVKQFLKYNEMQSFEEIIPGQVYYLEKKNKKAKVGFHIVKKDETLWDVAQKYGVRSKSIKKMNRMDKREALVEGRVVWLQSRRPKDEPVEFRESAPEPEKQAPKPEPIAEIEKPVEKNETHTKNEVENVPVVQDTIKGPAQPKEKIAVEAEGEFMEHIVDQGETMYALTKRYGVTVEEIQQWNNKQSTELKYGEVIRIKKK